MGSATQIRIDIRVYTLPIVKKMKGGGRMSHCLTPSMATLGSIRSTLHLRRERFRLARQRRPYIVGGIIHRLSASAARPPRPAAGAGQRA
jgi:hypothetical protein